MQKDQTSQESKGIGQAEETLPVIVPDTQNEPDTDEQANIEEEKSDDSPESRDQEESSILPQSKDCPAIQETKKIRAFLMSCPFCH